MPLKKPPNVCDKPTDIGGAVYGHLDKTNAKTSILSCHRVAKSPDDNIKILVLAKNYFKKQRFGAFSDFIMLCQAMLGKAL